MKAFFCLTNQTRPVPRLVKNSYSFTSRNITQIRDAQGGFEKAPVGFWANPKNQRQYMDLVFKELKLTKWEDWYTVKKNDILKLRGHSLMLRYENSHIKALTTLYPEYPWEIWKFRTVPKGYWEEHKNQLDFVKWFEKEVGITSPEDWYKIKIADVQEKGGGGLISHFGDSLNKLLEGVYPDVQWDGWRFEKAPMGFWKNNDNIKEYLDYLSEQLGIKKLDDWYDHSTRHIAILGGRTLLTQHGGLFNVLKKFYPEHPWDIKKFKSFGKSQTALYRVIQEIFPDKDIKYNYPHPELSFKKSNHRMELDIWIPDYNLAFEYQGGHHYQFLSPYYLFGSPKMQRIRDQQKKEACKEVGITLIDIPYWWDYSKDSVIATINKYRPDIISDPGSGAPIPERVLDDELDEDEEGEGKSVSKVIDFRNTKFLSGGIWDSSINPRGWWMSEQLDGVKAFWTGTTFFLPSTGKCCNPPESFVKGFPTEQLDGVLWGGRGNYNAAARMVASRREHWEGIQYVVTDAPAELLPFEERMEHMKKVVPKDVPNISVLEHRICDGQKHLFKYLEEVIEGSGDGIYIRKPESFYEFGHSNSLLKIVKYNLVYGKVISHKENRVLYCKLRDGTPYELKVEEDKEFPEPGSIISIKYMGDYSRDENGSMVFQFPELHRVHAHLSWEDVIRNEFPYFLQRGKLRGGLPKCRGCGNNITERNALRVSVIAKYSPNPQHDPIPALFSFCGNSKCVTTAVNEKSYFPPFDNVTYLPLDLEVKPEEITQLEERGIKVAPRDV